MEKQRRIKVLSLVALIVAVLGLTVAFAALSTTLNIKGRTEMNMANWDIHLENVTSETSGDGKVIKMPTISDDGTSLSGFEVSLTKPGDHVRFDYEIVNDGDIEAELLKKKNNKCQK